ncbi:hypothetical protein RUND412_011659, partial [Rhizina undulata]
MFFRYPPLKPGFFGLRLFSAAPSQTYTRFSSGLDDVDDDPITELPVDTPTKPPGGNTRKQKRIRVEHIASEDARNQQINVELGKRNALAEKPTNFPPTANKRGSKVSTSVLNRFKGVKEEGIPASDTPPSKKPRVEAVSTPRPSAIPLEIPPARPQRKRRLEVQPDLEDQDFPTILPSPSARKRESKRHFLDYVGKMRIFGSESPSHEPPSESGISEASSSDGDSSRGRILGRAKSVITAPMKRAADKLLGRSASNAGYKHPNNSKKALLKAAAPIIAGSKQLKGGYSRISEDDLMEPEFEKDDLKTVENPFASAKEIEYGIDMDDNLFATSKQKPVSKPHDNRHLVRENRKILQNADFEELGHDFDDLAGKLAIDDGEEGLLPEAGQARIRNISGPFSEKGNYGLDNLSSSP